MNMATKRAESECRSSLTKSGVRQPPVRAFMDDLTVTTTSVPDSRWILQSLEDLIISRLTSSLRVLWEIRLRSPQCSRGVEVLMPPTAQVPLPRKFLFLQFLLLLRATRSTAPLQFLSSSSQVPVLWRGSMLARDSPVPVLQRGDVPIELPCFEHWCQWNREQMFSGH